VKPGGSSPPGPSQAQAGPGGLWRNADYLCYRLALTISLLGGLISEIACPLMVLRLGGGAAQAGMVATCGLITLMVCQLPGGHITDRFDRRLLMIATDVVRFAALGSIPLAASWHGLTYPQLLVVAVIDGAAGGVSRPAATALLRDLVPAAQLNQAFGHGQGWRAAAIFAGPVLGGLLFGLQPALPFTADAISYALSVILLLRVSTAQRHQPGSAGTDQRITAGFLWLWNQRDIVRVLVFAAIVNLAGAATAVTIVIALREHGTAPPAIGAVMTCVGIGAFAGAPLARPIGARLGTAGICAVTGAAWVAGFLALTVSSSPWVAGPVLALPFFMSPATGLMLSTLVYGVAPRDLLGRVRTAEQLITTGLATAGPLLAGIALQALGIPWVWLVLGSCMAVVTVVAVAGSRERGEQDQAEAVAAREPMPSGGQV
jgi:predicted MFS family arabinose efflux permease